MEQQIIEILNVAKWAGATVVFTIYGLPPIISLIDKKWVKGNLSPKAETLLEKIEGNDLFHTNESLIKIVDKLDTLNSSLLRVENVLNEHSRDALIIKTKIMNGNKWMQEK